MKQDELIKIFETFINTIEQHKAKNLSLEDEKQKLMDKQASAIYEIYKDVYENKNYKNEKIRSVAIRKDMVKDKKLHEITQQIREIENKITKNSMIIYKNEQLFKAYRYAYGCKEVIL